MNSRFHAHRGGGLGQRLPALLLAVALAAGCSDEGDPAAPNGDPDPDPGAQLSFASDVQPIFDARCGPACHGANGNGGLDLRPGQSHASLVGVTSPTYQAPRIEAGDPAGSVLFNKITDTGVYGPLMPAGGPALSADRIAVIRAWIEAGAPDGDFDAPTSRTSPSTTP